MTEHLRKSVEWKGERGGLLEMRKQTVWYIKGLPNVRQLRERINKIEKLDELLQTFDEWREAQWCRSMCFENESNIVSKAG